MELESLQLDLDATEDGIFFPFSDDCEIKIAQWNNKAHKKFLRKLYQKHGRKIEAKALSDAQSNLLMADQWKYIIKDWSGMTSGGKEFKCNDKNILSLAKNPQYQKFFERIEGLAREEENFRIENIKEVGESSPTT